MNLADRHYVLEQGHIVYTGSREEFRAAERVRERHQILS